MTLVEFWIVRQSPDVEVILRFSMILPFWPSIVTAPDGVSVDCAYESPVKKSKQSAAMENRVAPKGVRIGCRFFPNSLKLRRCEQPPPGDHSKIFEVLGNGSRAWVVLRRK